MTEGFYHLLPMFPFLQVSLAVWRSTQSFILMLKKNFKCLAVCQPWRLHINWFKAIYSGLMITALSFSLSRFSYLKTTSTTDQQWRADRSAWFPPGKKESSLMVWPTGCMKVRQQFVKLLNIKSRLYLEADKVKHEEIWHV